MRFASTLQTIIEIDGTDEEHEEQTIAELSAEARDPNHPDDFISNGNLNSAIDGRSAHESEIDKQMPAMKTSQTLNESKITGMNGEVPLECKGEGGQASKKTQQL